MNGDDRRFEHVDRLHRAGDGVGDVMELQVEEDRQADMGDLVHAVMAVRAEELEPELEPADMRLDLFGKGLGGFELRNIESEVDRISQGYSDFSDPGFFDRMLGRDEGIGRGSTGVTVGVAATVRAAVCSEVILRRAASVVMRCSSHIGSRPSRNDITTSAGILVSRTSPSRS